METARRRPGTKPSPLRDCGLDTTWRPAPARSAFHRVTVNMALRLGKLCGDGPRIWLAMQQAYDMQLAESAMAAEIEKIPTLHAA